MKFNINDAMLKYCQNTLNSCCFSSLASDFEIINQSKAANSISNHIKELFTSQLCFRNHIGFANSVLKNRKIIKGEQVLYYNMKRYTHKGSFDILNDISKHVTLYI